MSPKIVHRSIGIGEAEKLKKDLYLNLLEGNAPEINENILM